jgi:PLP dependent protein
MNDLRFDKHIRFLSDRRQFCVDRKKNHGSNSLMEHIAQNIQSIREKMDRAAASCGRSPDEITLLAISKTFPKEFIVQAAAAGIHAFGENRVQEAEGKIPYLGGLPGLEWHLVGHLQTNKAKRAAELFDVVHSLDSLKLAARLNQASAECGKTLSVLIQVDFGEEETKFGAGRDQVREILAAMPGFTDLRLNGLMAIPPYFENPDEVHPYFARLRQLSEEFESEQPGCLGQKHLSMGMSHDFEQAIRAGSTIVRIGTAIFGGRQ